MTAQESPDAKKDSDSGDKEPGKEWLKSLWLAVPMLLLGMAVDWLKDKTITQPGQALWFIVPAIVFVGLTHRRASRQRIKLGPSFVAFFAVYILIFFVAAETSLLDWRRSLVGYKKSVPSNFLALNHLGDWHYRFATKRDEEWNLAVVLMKPAPKTSDGRLEIADLIRLAQISQAKGIALDFYFGDDPEDNRADDFLCAEIQSAKEKLPVFVGYDYRQIGDRIDRLPIDPDLEKCLSQDQEQHIVGYAEWDGIVRFVPLYFANDRSLESLSLKVARRFDPQLKAPDNGLLQFTKPENELLTTTFDRLMEHPDERSILTGRFILVGEDSAQDSRPTPYGVKPGVVIHAYAAYSLKHNRFIQRASWWSSLGMIFLCCYLIMVFTSRGAGTLKLILINAGFSLFILTLSALAMSISLTWIDVVYPLAATWLFLPLLISIRRLSERKTKVPQGESQVG